MKKIWPNNHLNLQLKFFITQHKLNNIAQDNLVYSLNDKEKTAKIINNNQANGDILIPRSIIYKSEEYIVTSIRKKSFSDSNIKSIKFSPDSELKKIEKEAFSNSQIESILIPSTVSDLEEGWFHKAPNLNKVTVMKDNQYYKPF